MDCGPNKSGLKSRVRGSVLIFVLAIVVLLSVLSLRLMKETMREIEHLSQFHKRDDLRVHAYSALEIGVGTLAEWKKILKESGKGLYDPAQGWGDPIAYSECESPDGITWKVEFEVENGKIPLETLRQSPELMAQFLEALVNQDDSDLSESDFAELGGAFRDWEDEDSLNHVSGVESESEYYEDLEPPYFAPNRPIQSFEEFKLIKGFGPNEENVDEGGLFFHADGSENESFKNFKRSVTLRTSQQLNVNSASSSLRWFLCGGQAFESAYNDVDSFLNGETDYGGFEEEGRFFQSPDDERLDPMKGRGIEFGVECKAFRVKVTVSRGEANFVLWALLEDTEGATAPSGNSTATLSAEAEAAKKRFEALKYPYRILDLRENENFID